MSLKLATILSSLYDFISSKQIVVVYHTRSILLLAGTKIGTRLWYGEPKPGIESLNPVISVTHEMAGLESFRDFDL